MEGMFFSLSAMRPPTSVRRSVKGSQSPCTPEHSTSSLEKEHGGTSEANRPSKTALWNCKSNMIQLKGGETGL